MILPLHTLFVGSNSVNSRDPSRISTTATRRCRPLTWPEGCFMGLLGTSKGSCIVKRGEGRDADSSLPSTTVMTPT
jgi:hypothetical protein